MQVEQVHLVEDQFIFPVITLIFLVLLLVLILLGVIQQKDQVMIQEEDREE